MLSFEPCQKGEIPLQLIGDFGTTLLAFIFVLGVMIFVHELGHYGVAKYLGIRVEVFSLGFGPRLLGFRRGDTDYRVSLLPLGGYVKMAGENYDESFTGSGDEFLARPKRHRFAVAIAGPLMNIVLAILLSAATYTLGVRVLTYRSGPAEVGAVASGSPAEAAGIQVRDTIVAIDGDEVSTWQDAEIAIATSPGQSLLLTLDRGGNRINKRVLVTLASDRAEVGTIGVEPWIPFLITGTIEGSPAQAAGLQPGDEIIEVRGKNGSVREPSAISPFVSEREGEPLLFKLRRGEEFLEATILPELIEGQVLIGVERGPPVHIEKYGIVESLTRSIRRNGEMVLLIGHIIGKIVTGKDLSPEYVRVPSISLAIQGAAASGGLVPLMGFMALVSLNLGIFNLFPIPVLDGGLIAMLAIEGLIGRDLSLKVKERIFQAGFIFLILLMGVILFNDVYKNLPF